MASSNNYNKASDATSPHPGNVVAEVSATEGIINDDSASTMDTNSGPPITVIHIPFTSDDTKCPFCERLQKNFTFINPSDLEKHLELHHLLDEVRWACLKCSRAFIKLHGVR